MFGSRKNDDKPKRQKPPGRPSPAPDSPGAQAPNPPQKQASADPDSAAIEQRARKLNLVGSSQLTRAVAEAVRRGLGEQFVFQEAQLEQAVRSIGRELMARLKANSKSVRGLPKDAFLREVKADKKRIEAAKDAARAELDGMLEKLKLSHEEVARHEAQLVRESKATGQLEDESLAARIAEIFAGGGSDLDIAGLREQITALALGSMQGQRDKSIDAQMSDHRKEVEHFERRIAKLTNSLELTEDELKRIAKAKNIDIGVGSIYRNVQGLSGSDDDYETKKELMSCIFTANLELQKGGAEAS